MPMYDYKCQFCFKRKERLIRSADLESTAVLCACGQPMLRQLSAPYVRGDYEAYESPVVPGKIISGRRAHEEHLRETGCRVLEPGERDRVIQVRREEEAKLDAKVEETVDRFITDLPTDKRDRLAGELEGGLDVKVERLTPKMG